MEVTGYKVPKPSRILTLAGACRVKGDANMVKVFVVAALLLWNGYGDGQGYNRDPGGDRKKTALHGMRSDGLQG